MRASARGGFKGGKAKPNHPTLSTLGQDVLLRILKAANVNPFIRRQDDMARHGSATVKLGKVYTRQASSLPRFFRQWFRAARATRSRTGEVGRLFQPRQGPGVRHQWASFWCQASGRFLQNV